MTALEYLQVVAPKLAALSTVNTYIAMAREETSSGYYGSLYEKAVALRAAHEWALAQRNPGESGPITSRTMGPASVGYGSRNNLSTSGLELTTYGVQLLALMRSMGPGILTLGHLDA